MRPARVLRILVRRFADRRVGTSEAAGRSVFSVRADVASRVLLLPLVLAFTVASVPTGAAGATDRWHAGETQRSTETASAGVRNHGNGALRLLVWYPATQTASEIPVIIGDPANPIFIAGRVAPNAPWADTARHPLVMLSHGFGGTGRQFTWLGTALARHGIVAVAVDHPGTNAIDGVTPEGAYAPWERAGDIVAALDLCWLIPRSPPTSIARA